MENGPFSTPEFDAFARGVVLFTHITSRIPGEKYGDLLSQKGGRGFPHLVIMDAEGDVLATHEGPRTVEGFQATAKAAQHYLDLKGLASPTPAQQVELLLAELQLGKVGLEAARQRKEGLEGLTPEQSTQIDQALTDLEIRDVLEKAQPSSQEEANRLKAELGARFQAMFKEGRRPAGDQATQAFYGLILDHAEQEKDAATFAEALGILRERYGKQPGTERFFKAQEERLAKLRQ